jgi:hypothetical protein
LEKQAEFQNDFFNLDDCRSDSGAEDSYYDESEEECEASDLDS